MDPSVCPCANTDPSTPPYPAPSACFLTFLLTKGLYKLCPIQRQDYPGAVLKQARNGYLFTVRLLLEDPAKVAPAETGKATRSGGRRAPQGTAPKVPGHCPSQLPSVIFGAGGVPVALVSWGGRTPAPAQRLRDHSLGSQCRCGQGRGLSPPGAWASGEQSKEPLGFT